MASVEGRGSIILYFVPVCFPATIRFSLPIRETAPPNGKWRMGRGLDKKSLTAKTQRAPRRDGKKLDLLGLGIGRIAKTAANDR